MALHTLATPGVYARDRSSLLRTGTVAWMAILPPRWSAKAGSKASSGALPAPAPVVLSLRGLTISAATCLTPFNRESAEGGHSLVEGWAGTASGPCTADGRRAGEDRTPGAPHTRPEPRMRGVTNLSTRRARAPTSWIHYSRLQIPDNNLEVCKKREAHKQLKSADLRGPHPETAGASGTSFASRRRPTPLAPHGRQPAEPSVIRF